METNFIKLQNKNIPTNNYIKIDNTLEKMFEYANNDKYCMGFTSDGMMKLLIEDDKIVDGNCDLYIHKERYDNYKKNIITEKIPTKIHFIWFYKGNPFNLVNYIAIMSALYNNPTYEVYIHCDREPSNNIYFEKLRDKIIVNKIIEPTSINNAPVYFFQHKADYVRLNILKEMGGIYLDTDIILLKNLDIFLNNNFVMGYERAYSEDFICNAVIMVTKNNDIINEWLHIYDTSWGGDLVENWLGHSVMVPARLKKKYGYLMNVVPNNIFYPFLWNNLSILYDTDNKDNYISSYAVHLWDTEAKKTNLLPQNVTYFLNKKNTFTRMFRKYVSKLIYEEDDFIVIEGMDSPENDVNFIRGNLNKLKEYCINNTNCVGFNTIGYMKSKINLDNLIYFDNNSYTNCGLNNKLYIYKYRMFMQNINNISF